MKKGFLDTPQGQRNSNNRLGPLQDERSLPRGPLRAPSDWEFPTANTTTTTTTGGKQSWGKPSGPVPDCYKGQGWAGYLDTKSDDTVQRSGLQSPEDLQAAGLPPLDLTGASSSPRNMAKTTTTQPARRTLPIEPSCDESMPDGVTTEYSRFTNDSTLTSAMETIRLESTVISKENTTTFSSPKPAVETNTPDASGPNPYEGIPVIPTKLTGVPKVALHSLYGQPPRRRVLDKTDYITWNDGGQPHILKFTTVFVCPLTGEIFPSGRYGDEKYYTADNTGPQEIIWYSKKTLAEHGAAARAYDCLSYRDAVANGKPFYTIGYDKPYHADEAMSIPKASDVIREKIVATQKKAFGLQNMQVDGETERPPGEINIR